MHVHNVSVIFALQTCFDRRGLKAALMLVPLFGLQLFLTIYRLPAGSVGAKEYEYLTIVVTNSQVRSFRVMYASTRYNIRTSIIRNIWHNVQKFGSDFSCVIDLTNILKYDTPRM